MTRDECLNEALTIINGDRAKNYGDAAENFANIATGWSVILGTDVTPVQVALCMDWVKTARLIKTPDHEDSWVDKAGYSALGAEVSSVIANTTSTSDATKKATTKTATATQARMATKAAALTINDESQATHPSA